MTGAMNLTKRFDDTMAVDYISATIQGGSVFGLIDTNGAGKPTLLRLASGVLEPDEGYMATGGYEVFENIPTKEHLFYISDKRYLFNNTAPEEMMRYYKKVYQGLGEVCFHRLMGSFGLGEKRKVYTFSEGMKKQVSVICDVCAGMGYLFCDKTFDGLDPMIRQAVENIFAADTEGENLAPIVTSHNLRELEDICDHVGLPHKDSIPLSKGLDDTKLNIHKIQCVLKPDMRPEDLTPLDKVNVEQGGSLCIIMARGNRGEMETIMVSYEPVFFEYIPPSLEEVFINEVEAADYGIRKLIF